MTLPTINMALLRRGNGECRLCSVDNLSVTDECLPDCPTRFLEGSQWVAHYTVDRNPTRHRESRCSTLEALAAEVTEVAYGWGYLSVDSVAIDPACSLESVLEDVVKDRFDEIHVRKANEAEAIRLASIEAHMLRARTKAIADLEVLRPDLTPEAYERRKAAILAVGDL